MTDRAALKRRLQAELDAAAKDIYDLADRFYACPELGFKEFETAGRVAETLRDWGIPYRDGLAITGVKGVIRGRHPGPTVAVLAELDGLKVPLHPGAEGSTGAAHACGHYGQITVMLAVARALQAARALDDLAGNVVIFAVPAEEFIEVEYRLSLRAAGKLEFLAGKQELIARGEFDDVDLAILVHMLSAGNGIGGYIPFSNNGVIAKQIRYLGRAAHAGSMPHAGVNALNAATLAIQAIHMQRETFRDDDTIRVHPIITRGGDAVNVVPADVRMETFVRGKTIEAIADAEGKVDRSLRAGALAIGAEVTITTVPAYLPLNQDPRLTELYRANVVPFVGENNFPIGGHRTGSTDMGDISQIMPAVQPYAAGFSGVGHGADFIVHDRETAFLTPAKAILGTIVDLLADDAQTAREVIAAAQGRLLTKDQYLTQLRQFNRVETFTG